MGIGTFGSFTQARLAIYAAQAGLQVTGNNISNVSTEGYTRQRLDQSSLYIGGSDRYSSKYDLRIGQGVLCSGVSQLRDPYLDIRYRNEMANVGYMNEKLDTLNKIAYILDETGKGVKTEGDDFGLAAADIADMESALRALTLETGHQEYDNQVREAALALCTKLRSYSARLQQEYDSKVTQIEKDVKDINDILYNIRDLNETIRNSEIHGQDALELRDKRNLLIDELAEKIHIDVTYVPEEIGGGVTVQKLIISLAGDNPDPQVKDTDRTELINGIYGSQISIDQVPQPNTNYDPENPDTGLPYLDKNNKPTSNLVAAQYPKVNDKYDATVTDPTAEGYGQYLKPDGSGTNNADEAQKLVRENPNFPKYLKGDGTPTDKEDEAKLVNNPNFNITVSELRDSQEKLMFYTDKVVDKIGKDEYIAARDAGKLVEESPRNADGSYTITVYQWSTKDKYTKVTYTKTPSKETPLDDNDLHGALQATREMLTEKGEFADTEVINEENTTGPYRNNDEGAVTKRGIPYYQRSLDALAQKLASTLNEANKGYMTDSNGNYVTPEIKKEGDVSLNVPVTIDYTPTGTTDTKTYTLNKYDEWDKIPEEVRDELQKETGLTFGDTTADGKTIDKQMILNAYLGSQAKNADGTDKVDENGDPVLNGVFKGVNLFSNNGDTNDDTDITASNITISYTWARSEALVRSFIVDPGKTDAASGDSTNLNHMLALMQTKMQYHPDETPETRGKANHDVMFTGTFHEMWNNIGFILGEEQHVNENLLGTHEQNALEIDMGRDSVSAVDFNDEAMNLMMYSKSYNAACRLMTTIDSVLDKLVNGTGMTT